MVSTQSLDAIVAQHPFFASLGTDACRVIAGCGKNVVFKPGEPIYRQGDPADTFYVIRHGKASLEVCVAGRRLMLATLGDNEILNPSWLAPPYVCQFDARALELTRAIAFDAACLRTKCEADHHLGYELMKRFVPVMMERLAHARLQALDIYGTGRPS